MMRYVFFSCFILAFSGCCTKKKCLGDLLPYISVQFAGVSKPGEDKATVYTFVNNSILDSATYLLGSNPATIMLMPYERNENTDKSYTIKWNGKTETISNMHCDFKEEKIKCNTCFLFIPDKETVSTFDNFTYTSSSGAHQQGDTLFLNW